MDRRQALFLLGRGVCGAIATGTWVGCGSRASPPQATRIPLDEIPDGGRLEIEHGGQPVELVRSGRRLEARSLWCTHYGCRVRWSADEGAYLCACHGGRFDIDGRPAAGPPTRPLPRLAVALADDIVTVGGS